MISFIDVSPLLDDLVKASISLFPDIDSDEILYTQ